jgi:hypothetical protein
MPEKHSASLAFIAWTMLQGNSTARFVQHLNSEVCSNWPAPGAIRDVTEASSGGCRRSDELVRRLLFAAIGRGRIHGLDVASRRRAPCKHQDLTSVILW